MLSCAHLPHFSLPLDPMLRSLRHNHLTEVKSAAMEHEVNFECGVPTKSHTGDKLSCPMSRQTIVSKERLPIQ
jgi:hypothetical protein